MAYDYARPINVIASELVSALAMAQADLARPIVYFTSALVSVTEGNSGTKTLTFEGRRSSLSGILNVSAVFDAGSSGPADFAGNAYPGNKTLAFVNNSDTATFSVVVSGDTDVESDDTFTFTLQPGSTYRLGTPSSVTGVILNDDNAQTPSAFAMTQLASANRVYPRTTTTGGGAGKGAGPIPVTLNVTQAGTIYARTRSTASGNAILQAAYLGVSSASVGNGPVNIPNVDARPEEFYLDLSPDGTTWTNGTTAIGMGVLSGYGGQSLQYNNLVRATGSDTLANVGETATDKGSVYFDGAWRRVVEATNTAGNTVNGAGMNVMVRLLAEKFGCRVGLVGHAISATSIDIWVPGGGAGWDGLSAAINATGNRLEGFDWLQGHSDAGKSGAQYRAQLDKLMAGIDGLVTNPTFTRYLTTIPNISSTTQWGDTLQRNTIRNAGERWTRDNPRAVSVPFDDIDQIDGVHPNQTGSKRQGLHKVRAASANGDRAFTAHTVTKVGAVLTIAFTLAPGATALNIVGDFASRIGVWRRGMIGTVAKLPVNAVAVGAASGGIVPVTITLASDPGDVLLDIWFHPKPDPDQFGGTGILIDNYASESGVTFGRQVASVRPFMLKARRDLVLDSATFGAGVFGQQALTGGYAYNPDRIAADAGVGSTMEFWVYHPGAGGNNIWANLAGRYLGASGTSLIASGGNGGAAPSGQWLHVAWTFDGGVRYTHINGVLVQSGQDQAYKDEALAIRAFGGGGAGAAVGTAICQVAVFSQAMRNLENFTPPTAAYTGNEAYLLHLWPLNGTGVDIAVR